jgi:putative nucleotidyltransferase with HDIG domain
VNDSSQNWGIDAAVSAMLLLSSPAIAVAISDERGVIRQSNDTFRTWFALDDSTIEHDIVDTPCHLVRVDGSHLERAEHPAILTLANGEPHSGLVMGVDAPDHARRWLVVSSIAVRDEDAITGVMSWYSDVTATIESNRAQRLVSAVNSTVISAASERDFLEETCEVLVAVGGFSIARIAVAAEGDDGTVEDVVVAGTRDFFRGQSMVTLPTSPLSTSPTARALRTGSTALSMDLLHDESFAPWRERAQRFNLASAAAIPLNLNGRYAALNLYADHPWAFDEITLANLEGIAEVIEFAAGHVKSIQDLARALDGTLSVLARITELRDPYTAGHQGNVSHLSEAMATHLGLDATMQRLVRQAGEVHDIGKMAIPAEVLSRPGTLDDVERRMVELHATRGYEILSEVSLPWPLAEVAWQHHERLDGSGYPQGLRGADISLPSRIVAVADVVGAMTHHRPYRPALGVDVALDEISRGRDTKFDADAVDACVALFSQGFAFDTERSSPRSEGVDGQRSPSSYPS